MIINLRAKSLTFLLMIMSSGVISSDFGTRGLIDIPTARMSADGLLTTTAAIQSKTNSYAISYQATPWLEGTFRYTGFNEFGRWDRNYELKMRIWQERTFFPQVALGIRDLVGTGVYASEYLVASKKIGSFDVTLGLGWGRLAGDQGINNPFGFISDKFKYRPGYDFNNDIEQAGMLATDLFFRGEKTGFFGGMSYTSSSLPFTFLAEYNPDQYDFEYAAGSSRPKSPLSMAVKWDGLPGVSITFSRQHQEDWGIELNAALDTQSFSPKSSRRLYQSSLDMNPSNLPSGIDKNVWYDTLLFDAERSGLLLIEATINKSSNTATIVMGNLTFPLWTDAIDHMVNLADLHLPETVRTLNFIIEEEGYRVNSISVRRPSLGRKKNRQLTEFQVNVEPVRPLTFVEYRTDFVQKKIVFDVNLNNRLQLFDPDDPARYQLYAKIGISMQLPFNWILMGAVDKDITNNFGESTRQSDSVLQRVRSDIVRYLNEGETGIDALFLQRRGNFRSDIFYRVYGGILESMYSGVGGEILYQPFQSRLAFGVNANWVKQRDFEKTFKHLEYQTSTAFISAYWATPFYNFDIAIHAGKYLAQDVGATLEIRRTFDNGWMVGAWATRTNVSAEDFGEGGFDKGLFFKVPLNGFFGNSKRSSYTTRIRPVQRDGGQYLENFSGNIWWDTRSARFDALNQSKNRLYR